MPLPRDGGIDQLRDGEDAPDSSPVEERYDKRYRHQRDIFPDDPAEEKEKQHREHQAAGPYMQGLPTDKPRNRSADEPENRKNLQGNLTVKIEEKPDQDEQRQRVGAEMGKGGMEQRGEKDATEAGGFTGNDPQSREIQLMKHRVPDNKDQPEK